MIKEARELYKTETHLHTCEVSGCGRLPAAEMVKLYHEAGYHTLFITDHFDEYTLSRWGELPWEEKITRFLAGYEAAKAAAADIDMDVLLSAEIRLNCSPNHYLVYGIDRDFLENLPGKLDILPQNLLEYAHEKDAMVIQAHPRRPETNPALNCFPTPEFVDGFEVFNSNPRHDDNNKATFEQAKSLGLLKTAGSDAHRYEDVAGTGVYSRERIRTAEQFISLIRTADVEFINTEGL